MEEIDRVNCCSEGRSSSESRPPNPNPPTAAAAYRQCQRTDPVVFPCKKSLVRHASLVSFSSLNKNKFQKNVFFLCSMYFHCANDAARR